MNYKSLNPQGSPHKATRFQPLIIGGGRLAHHFHHYLNSLGTPNQIFPDSRKLAGLDDLLNECSESSEARFTHFWLMVSDDALSALSITLFDRYSRIPQIHSSATLSLPLATTLHPLMSFGPELYPKENYERFPLTVIKEEIEKHPDFFGLIRSTFQNQILVIKDCDRVRYHLNCSMISNFSVLLWDAAMTAGPDLPSRAFQPILQQTLQNFMHLRESALTGPLARGDKNTLNRHLEILQGTPEQRLYEAFMEYHAHRT
ncbi:MAG: DUF2520 domain-containing protein [Bdellovibrionales bacterium]|nr:DUF2520 domain-containing protein [Bdellovibrionales bacterium]